MNSEWHISSLIVHARPDHQIRVRGAIESLPGVELHGNDEHGKFVVTVEASTESGIVDCIDSINRTEGVLSTVLVYHHNEDMDSLEDEIELEDTDDETDSPRVY